MREIKVNELKEGMTTAVDVFSPKGQLILKRHQAVSAFDIAKFGFYNIASVYVEGSSAQEKEEWNKKYAIIKEKYRDSIDNLHEYIFHALLIFPKQIGSKNPNGTNIHILSIRFLHSCALKLYQASLYEENGLKLARYSNPPKPIPPLSNVT